jgi:hypothetical protein
VPEQFVAVEPIGRRWCTMPSSGNLDVEANSTAFQEIGMEFSHVGMITHEPKEGEVFVEATRVWITNFVNHPHHVEWLRFEPDSPVTGPLRTQPHVAYRVDSIERASQGMQVLMEPFEPLENVRVGFYLTDDGAVVEFMEYEGNPFG